MNKEEILEDVKRHLDYVNATKQKSIRDTEMEVMYQEIERLQNIINELEKWLLSEQGRYKDYLSSKPTNDSEYNSKYATQSALAQLDVVLDKLKELKEGNK